jgi:thiol-disulfide isomerase/thioredoxin
VIADKRSWFVGVAAVAALLGLFALQRPDSGRVAESGGGVTIRSAEFWGTTLPDLARQPQALKQWLGQVVVVNFWAPWCPPCREEIPGFIRLQDRLGSQGLRFVGVALDDEGKVQAYVDETGINYPVLLGGMDAVKLGQAAGNRLGGLPYTVVFDRGGNAVASLVGGISEARLEGLVKPLL